MKYLKILLIALKSLLFISTGFLNAQEFEVTQSKHDILNSIIKMHQIFGHDADRYYVMKFTGTQYFIEKMDNHMNSVNEESIKLFQGLKTYQLQAAFHFYNELYIFFSHTRINDITLYYQKIDKNSLLPLTEPITIATIKNVKGAWADFHFALSKNETKLLVACRTKLTWSGAQFNEMYVFGENFELLWKRKDSFEFRGQGPRDNLYLVDETGNVSVLSLMKRESIISLIRDYRNLYAIYRYTHDGNDFNEYPITLNDKYIRGIRIIAGENGDLICAGLYSEIFKTGIRGTFFMRIDGTTSQVLDNQLNSFDDATMAELAGMNEPTIRNEELLSYVITDIVLRNDGKMILIAEQVFHQTYNTYNNIIVTNYDLSGQVYWTRIIGKKQNFNFTNISAPDIDLVDYRDFIRGTGYMDASANNLCSYALMAPVDGNKIVLFYNDDIRNMNNPAGKAFSRPRKSYLLAVTIDEFGNVSKQPLIPWKKKQLFPEPIRFYDTLHETIVIPAFRNRSINFYKITARF
jgi:hypothetical protein